MTQSYPQFQAVQVVDFYEGRMRLPTNLNPADWHPRASIIYVLGDIEVPEWVIELALDYGFHYNPYTRAFVNVKL